MQTDNKIFQLAFDLINFTDMHLFLTGEAGTGKTTFLRFLKEHTHKHFAVVAPSGVAAMHAGGTTIHSLLMLPVGGVYLPEGNAQNFLQEEGSVRVLDRHSLVSSLRLNSTKRKLLQELELLIIDEISMVRADMLDMISAILQTVRKNREPFGGVQMLYIGDLYQLPPVVKREEEAVLSSIYASPYFFDARVIAQAPPQFLALKKVYRQRDDYFVALLNKVRNNQMDDAAMQTINSLVKPGRPHADEGYITLTSHNDIADAVNQKELLALPGELITQAAIIEKDFPEKSYPVDQNLALKTGARVMFVKNDVSGARQYFNGKTGTVLSVGDDEVKVLADGSEDPVTLARSEWLNTRYRWNENRKAIDEEVLGTFLQFPLRLAWAVSIHKSQGLTFEKMVVDAGRSFTPGQVYVALSRATTLQGIRLASAISPNVIAVHPRVKQFHSKERSESKLIELVARGKKQYVKQAIAAAFDFNGLSLPIASLIFMFRQMDLVTSQPFLAWTNMLEKFRDDRIKEVAAFGDSLRHAVDDMFNPEGSLELNNLLQNQVPRLLASAGSQLVAVKKSLPSRFDLFEYVQYPQIEEQIREIFQKAEEQLAKLVRLKDGYREETFFANTRYVVELSAKSATKTKISTGSSQEPKEAIAGHPKLVEALKQTLRRIASEQQTEVFKLLSYRYLDAIAATMPGSPDELICLPGFGPVKLKQIGDEVLATIEAFRQSNPDCQPLAEISHFQKAKRKTNDQVSTPKKDTVTETVDMWQDGKSVADIAHGRTLTTGTIKGHLAKAIRKGIIDGHGLVPAALLEVLATHKTDGEPVRPENLWETHKISVDWGDLAIANALLEMAQA